MFDKGVPGGSDGRESACSAEDPGWIPGSGGSLSQEDPLEEEVITYSSILAWKSHRQRTLVGLCEVARWQQ